MLREINTSFFIQLNNTFFTQYGKFFSSQTIKKNVTLPFKDHAQLPLLIDILSRKDDHHAVLFADFPPKLFTSFVESLLFSLNGENVPPPLCNVELIYFDAENIFIPRSKQKAVERDFQYLWDTLHTLDKYLLIALSDISLATKASAEANNGFLLRQFEILLGHPKCRMVILTNNKDSQHAAHFYKNFSFLSLAGPTDADVMTILKQQRIEFENFHHVSIPEDLLPYAYALAERYLSTCNPLEKALLLLDSSAARAGATERTDNNNQYKPVLTPAMITSVLSGWTQIPVSHLSINKFKLNDFTQNMQQRIFGQNIAITILGHELQQSQAHLQQTVGPFCRFLFAGPAHAGKKTTALAFTEQLFKQLNVLFFAELSPIAARSIADIKLQRCTDKRYFPLKEIIREIPYCVIFFEDIDQASPAILDGLHEVFSTGYLHDDNGEQYNFRQSILILSTTLGTRRLSTLANAFISEDDAQHVDLMQLVMSEQKQEIFSNQPSYYSSQAIVDEILSEVTSVIPASLCQHLCVVPFLPLDIIAIEKIIRLKLKTLSKVLDARYGIELGYAPEVIHYLANEVMKHESDNLVVDTEKALKQLYFVIEQAILSQADNKNCPNQLFLQLNETGQLLRCDWLVLTTVRHHTP